MRPFCNLAIASPFPWRRFAISQLLPKSPFAHLSTSQSLPSRLGAIYRLCKGFTRCLGTLCDLNIAPLVDAESFINLAIASRVVLRTVAEIKNKLCRIFGKLICCIFVRNETLKHERYEKDDFISSNGVDVDFIGMRNDGPDVAHSSRLTDWFACGRDSGCCDWQQF